MKKHLFSLTLLSVLLLSGCFGSSKDESAQKPAEQDQQAQQGQASIQPTEPSSQQTSTFNDGDYFLKAVAEGKVEICGKIGSASLKDRCVTRVKGK